MRILALDTCLAACQAAIVEDGRCLALRSEPMARGHQERLALMTGEAMDEASLRFEALDRIAVTVGPGSFTGLRVGVAFAKGLALALDRPCVGVGTLAALAASAPDLGPCVAAIDAGRGLVYLQMFDGRHAVSAPDILPLETAAARLLETGGDRVLIGPQAMHLAGALSAARALDIAAPSPVAIACLAQDAPTVPVRPLYLRAPDARVSGK